MIPRLKNRLVGLLPHTPTIYHVTADRGEWVLYQIAQVLSQELSALGRRAAICHEPWNLRSQILHFGDRYAYLDGPYQKLHPSNKIFLTWHHGNPNDPNSGIQRIFEQLPAALPYLHKIVVSCETTRQNLIAFGISPQLLVKIPIGVQLSAFSSVSPEKRQAARESLGIPLDAICIGSFQKDGQGWGDGDEPKLIKGPDVFLEVMAALKPRYPKLFVLLTGPSRGYVKKGLAALALPYVHQHATDYAQMARYYHALDCYAITSRDEGGPIALMESWASGVPLVSTRMGMPADLIQHGLNGLLAEVEDSAALAEHLAAIIEDQTLGQKLSTAALAAVKAYDWPRIAAQYDALLYAPLLD